MSEHPHDAQPAADPVARPVAVRAGTYDFEDSYAGTPPWDVGHPQPAFAALAEAGALVGRVLDAGCGTGEHALMAAERGHEVTGFDIASTAIARAEEKARQRGLAARFLVWDAREVADLGGPFDTVLDSGLFHVFDDADQARYVAGLAAVVPSGGRVHVLCFSERVPGDSGPRRITRDRIRAAFAGGWHVERIDATEIEATVRPEGVPAWCATIVRA